VLFADSCLPPADGSASLAPARFIDQLRALGDDRLLSRASWFRQQVTEGLIPQTPRRRARKGDPAAAALLFQTTVSRYTRVDQALLRLLAAQPDRPRRTRDPGPRPRLAGRGTPPRPPPNDYHQPAETHRRPTRPQQPPVSTPRPVEAPPRDREESGDPAPSLRPPTPATPAQAGSTDLTATAARCAWWFELAARAVKAPEQSARLIV
jgi:hypothetical protein